MQPTERVLRFKYAILRPLAYCGGFAWNAGPFLFPEIRTTAMRAVTRLRCGDAGKQRISMELRIQYSRQPTRTLGGLDDWNTAMLGSSYGAPGLLGLGSMTLAESRQAEASKRFCVAAIPALGFIWPRPKPSVPS
jgi:hypothetical protein